MPLSQLMTQTDTTPTMFAGADETWATEDYRTTSTRGETGDPSYGFVLRIGTVHYVFSLADPNVQSWLESSVQELNRIAGLRADWDSYGALPVNENTLKCAFDVLVKLMAGRSRGPQIGASVGGGVTLEWHRPGSGLEVRIEGPSRVHAYFYDDNHLDDAWEDDVGWNYPAVLEPYIDRLTA